LTHTYYDQFAAYREISCAQELLLTDLGENVQSRVSSCMKSVWAERKRLPSFLRYSR